MVESKDGRRGRVENAEATSRELAIITGMFAFHLRLILEEKSVVRMTNTNSMIHASIVAAAVSCIS
jgi:hypothetical protein